MPQQARGVFEAANAGFTVLTPNNELAVALTAAVEQLHLAAGHAVWQTPRIREFTGWIRQRYAELQIREAVLPRALSDIEERELWRAVVLDGDADGALLEPSGAARGARRARRALYEHGIPEAALRSYATDETLAFQQWNRAFEGRCRDLGCAPADQLAAAIGGDGVALAWIDSPQWRPTARRWLEQHAARVLRPAAMPRPATARRVRSGSAADELRAMAAWAEAQRRGGEFRAWICVPDLALRRSAVIDAFDAALAPQRYGLAESQVAAPYAVAGGVPLADLEPVRAALAALAATGGRLSFEEWSALLRSPGLQESDAEACAAASLDETLRRRGPPAASLDEWLALAGALHLDSPPAGVAAVRRLRALRAALAAVRGAQPLSRWVAVWMDALDAGPWALRRRWSSAEFQAAERFRELLASLATSDPLFGALSAGAAVNVLARAARDTAFQAHTGVPPVWITAELMDPWLAYDGIWVARCTAEHWPPPADPVPLLPVRLQREFGVIAAGADTQRQFAEELLGRWLLRAARIVFSHADDADGRRAVASPLLPADVPEDEVAGLMHPVWRAVAAAAPAFDSVLDERAPPFAAPERLRGVTALRAQSRCAFRGFAEARLAAQPLHKPVPGFDSRERGEMLHRALENLWSELGGSGRLAALARPERDALVQASVRRVIAVQCRQRDPGAKWRERELPRMGALLHKWLDTELARAPFTVERLEGGTRTARHGGLEFEVRIDRIDRLADGGRVLIDYKTGAVAADWRGDRPDNPQLCIYAVLEPHALVAVAYGKVNAAECGFVAEAAREGLFKPRGKATALEGMPDFAALTRLWSDRLDVIAAEFAAGVATVTPAPRACASCTLHALCRIPGAFSEELDSDE